MLVASGASHGLDEQGPDARPWAHLRAQRRPRRDRGAVPVARGQALNPRRTAALAAGHPPRICRMSMDCGPIAWQCAPRPRDVLIGSEEPVRKPPGENREESDMHPKRFYLSTVAAIGLAALLAPVQAGAQTAVAIDNDDIGGVVTGPNGPEAGVWVIAETNDLADPVHAQRGHRRSGPLRGARPAEGQVQGLGARLRARRFPEGRCRARQAAQSHRRGRPERGRGGAILSGDLLVFDAEDSGRGPVRRQERHPGRSAGRSTGST